MSAFYDMISAFVAMLMSAAFLHFGAAESHPVPNAPPSQAMAASMATPEAPAADPADDDAPSPPAAAVRPHARHLSAHRQCHGAPPTLETVHAASPVRRG